MGCRYFTNHQLHSMGNECSTDRNPKEGVNSSIQLKAIGSGDDDDEACDDPEAIKLMVHFFYHLDYEATPVIVAAPLPRPPSSPPALLDPLPDDVIVENVPLPDDPWSFPERKKKKKKAKKGKQTTANMVTHARVFAAAVKYQVSALRRLAATKFAKAVDEGWDHDTFAEATRVAYTTTSDDVRALRDVAANAIHANHQLLDKECIKTVVCDIPGLGYELLRKAHGMPPVVGMIEDETVPDVPICNQCETPIRFVDCSNCLQEYLGCCNESCPRCGGV